MEVKLGIFAVPDATDSESTVEQILAADRSGLDLVGVQDHPYQRRFHDTWTLLSYAAGRTERAFNIMALDGRPDGWADQLARIATELRFSTLLVGVPGEDPVGFIRRLGEDTAPHLRELLA
jgi:alkanesulfonate monooxygenase SsuD/methylene tetrahydromethanopterin reductase-like flavin-dependent oxidoreductase (luciferase family)